MRPPAGAEQSSSPFTRPLPLLLAMLTLVTFTVSQSLYEMLAGNRELLALRLESNWQLLELVLVFNLLPAVVLFALGWALTRLHPAAGRIFLGLVCFLLFLTFFFQLDNTYFLRFWRGFSQSFWVWLLPATGLSILYLRCEKTAYKLTRALSPVVVLFPALFLARTWADTSAYVPTSLSEQQSEVSADTSRKLPPIVIFVLDELSLPALLDASGGIDAARFPNFHALAQQSHWFRNATANADHTTRSVPALLTGNLPLPSGAPSFRDYPENLFTWLQPHYPIYVWETWTHFCVPRVFHCMGALHENTSGRADLYRDIVTLYADRVLPGGIGGGSPEDRRTWALLRDPHRLMQLRLLHLEGLFQGLDTIPQGDRYLIFFHHDLPHSPYWLTPDGTPREIEPAKFDSRMTGDPAVLSGMLERYREQIMFVDQNLGRLLAALRDRGEFDDSLLIVSSDHGVSYRTEAPGRNMSERAGGVINADLLLSVPLLIKLPHQQRGEISDQDVQLIDILPTLSGILALRVPWKTDGRSALAPPAGPRPKVAFDRLGRRFEFSDDLGLQALGYRLAPTLANRKERAAGP